MSWADTVTSYTFTSKSWAATCNGQEANWTSGKDGNSYLNNGVQVTTGVTGANATSPKSFTNVSRIVVTYCTNTKSGKGTVTLKVGSDTFGSQSITAPSANGTEARTFELTSAAPKSGDVNISVACSTNSIFIIGVEITESTGGDPTKTTPTLSFAAPTYETTMEEGFVAPELLKTDGIDVTFASSLTEVATVEATTGAVTLVAPGTTTITASFAGNDTYNAASASYDLKVVPVYTVAWSVNGTVVKTEKLKEGEEVNAPVVEPAGGKVHTGWVTTETVAANVTPAYVTPSATESVTYYAVYAKQTGSGEATYTKLTSNSFEKDAHYVLAAEESGSNKTLHYFSSYSGTTANENWGLTSTDVSEAIVFTLSGTADALAALDEYGHYIQALATGKFRMSATKATLKLSESGEIYNPASGSTGYNLRYNHNNGAGGFRWYNSSTGQSAYFYKKIGGVSFSDFTTIIPSAGTISFVATSGDGKYYATFSSERAIKFDEEFANEGATCSASVKAYAVAVHSGELLRTDLHESNNDGNYTYVPANTGVLFEYILENGEFDGAVPFEYYDQAGESLSPITDNMLVPTTTDGQFKAEADGNHYYKLAYGDFENKTKLGFWWGAEDGSGMFNVKAGGAVLVVPAAAGSVRGFSFDGEDTTGIESLAGANEAQNTIYNLQGVRMQKLVRGVNIMNGRKVLR